MANADGAADKNEFSWRRNGVAHGRFRLRAGDPDFGIAGPIRHVTFVFAREPVRIIHAGADPVVADSASIMLYNADQEYRREHVGPRGDRSEWFALEHGVPESVVASLGLRDNQRHRPFERSQVSCPSRLYKHQLRLSEDLRAGLIDGLEAEERVTELVDAVFGALHQDFGSKLRLSTRPSTAVAHHRLVQRTRELVGLRFREPLSLKAIAKEVHASPYHLARVFRAHTGAAIHEHVTRLRLACSLERIADGDPLSDIALELGFVSHSHFTHAFRKSLGVTPSAWRRSLTHN